MTILEQVEKLAAAQSPGKQYPLVLYCGDEEFNFPALLAERKE